MQNSYLTQIKDYNIRQVWPTQEKAVLLVIDMQLYFKDVAQPIVDNVISIIECLGRTTGKSSSRATDTATLRQTEACWPL